MRRLFFGLAVMLGLSSLVPSAQAQIGGTGFSDPFFLYYGFYLPRQQYLAATPGPELMINNQAAAQQFRALTERGSLYDPLGGAVGEDYDPMQPFAGRTRGGRTRTKISPNGITATHVNGSGPMGYYNRTMYYYPSLRTGRMALNAYGPGAGGVRPGVMGTGRTATVGTGRGMGGMGMGMGMGGMGMGGMGMGGMGAGMR
jgi:hypothetical protein